MKENEERPGVCNAQLKVAVTTVSVCNTRTHVPVPVQAPPDQPPNVEGATGVAVRVMVVPLGKLSMQLTSVLAQLKPEVEVTVPVPLPEKLTVKVGPAPPPPLLVPSKQTTFAVMLPVTTAPDDDTPDPSALVVTVAETKVAPQTKPVAVSKPAGVMVNICGSLEAQVTWLVISFVTGGWR